MQIILEQERFVTQKGDCASPQSLQVSPEANPSSPMTPLTDNGAKAELQERIEALEGQVLPLATTTLPA